MTSNTLPKNKVGDKKEMKDGQSMGTKSHRGVVKLKEGQGEKKREKWGRTTSA